MAQALERASRVRLMLFDVDGVLTDGTLYLGEAGEPIKAFNVRDGHGLKMLRDSGIEVGLLSSRRSAIVQRRAAELGVQLVAQGAADKLAVFRELIARERMAPEDCGFMGDDLVDLKVMLGCGFCATVPEAPAAVRDRAHYVTRASGGRGAAREVCELLIASRGASDEALARYLP